MQRSALLRCIVSNSVVYAKKAVARMGSRFFDASGAGLERAAPVRTLVKKRAGGTFLARGRVL